MPTKLTHRTDILGALCIRVEGHVPYHKFPWQAKGAVAELRVKDYDGHSPINPQPWTEISLTERTVLKNGDIRSRTISITLDPATRAALIALLTKEA